MPYNLKCNKCGNWYYPRNGHYCGGSNMTYAQALKVLNNPLTNLNGKEYAEAKKRIIQQQFAQLGSK